ncbi:DUF1700 domain-containing protein [Cohnella faecalis]|uniref:DUF1700 domain-containing protein n=1 Tax=Cohnella faecalis TaxID=2315694 RepID=A0A398CHM0_9BACL|nr:DUF1700 domain-containing protein [Cohnella faecalis]RIE01930.1 DUF1700 domain-containing protein [Cohnella faecalis]
MNRQEYMELLAYYLSSLPDEEREELLRDYDAHFAFGLQNGKKESDIAQELGNPAEIASEIVGPGFSAPVRRPGPDAARMTGVSIMLFFVHLVMLPLAVAFWSLFVAYCAVTLAFILSPVAFLLDLLLYGDYYQTKLFVSIGVMGVGMLLATFLPAAFRKWSKVSIGYGKWVARTWRGRA